jgi:3-oxoacyl-[acyl-carrier protein] reductase
MALPIDLRGRTALVTGGTRGIGAAIADTLERAGATLLVTGTRADDVARRNEGAVRDGRGRVYLTVDFANGPSQEAFLRDVATRPIDILVNNAGINRIQTVPETTPEDFDALVIVNLRAPFLCARAVAPGMAARQWGRIVNIASIWGVITKAGRSLYTTTKHGLVGLTKTLAVEYAAHGVLVNAVSPGFTRTELTDSTLTPDEQAALARQVPAARFAAAGEMATVVAFLASDLNTYVTGQNIVVDGGFTSV